jgi:hypothetical protein
VDTTAGPGSDTGFQAPALAGVSNPNGVGLEMFAVAVLNGKQATYLPWIRWVLPLVVNLHDTARTFDGTLQMNTYEGQAFENPNWGSGPFGDWQFDSSKVYQYARYGGVLPTPSFSPTTAAITT